MCVCVVLYKSQSIRWVDENKWASERSLWLENFPNENSNQPKHLQHSDGLLEITYKLSKSENNLNSF